MHPARRRSIPPGLEPFEQPRQVRLQVGLVLRRRHSVHTPPPRPCVFAGRLRASTPHQHDAPASSGSASAPSEPAPLSCVVAFEMTSRPNVPAICPSASSIIRSAASHPPGPLGRVPRPHRYYQPTPTSRPPSTRHFVSFAQHYHRFARLRSLGTGRFPESLDHFYRGARAASARWRRRDIPGSWTTLAYMPRSSTPADRRTQATTGPAMWSSANLTTSTPHGTLSRLYHAACTLSVYASQPGSPPDHATLDSGWWPALTGQGSHLLGRVEGFRHVYPSTWLSPSPSFAWRNKSLFLHPAIVPRNTLEMCDSADALGERRDT